MKNLNMQEVLTRSKEIRNAYHSLEQQHHGSKWTVEEDALAFLTDAALVGRYIMSQQGRWPAGAKTIPELQHKLGECVWWLTTLADRTGIDINEAVQQFFAKTEKQLSK